METLSLLIAASIDSGTILALASLGLLVNERSGVINLGAEGLMLVAAVTGFATAFHTSSTVLAFLVGGAAAGLLAAVFGYVVIWLNANQYATGLALGLLGSGLSAFFGVPYTREALERQSGFSVPLLGEVPWLGAALFRQHPMVYVAVGLALGIAWLSARTRAGLVLRAVGESPESAHALGYPVRRIRLGCVVAGGAACGLAGVYTSVVHTPLWIEGMTAGTGWIALALTTFATWRPLRALFGAYLFGGVTMLQLHLQGQGVNVPVQLLTALPYLSTLLVLVLISRNPAWIAANMPASLGKPFHAGA